MALKIFKTTYNINIRISIGYIDNFCQVFNINEIFLKTWIKQVSIFFRKNLKLVHGVNISDRTVRSRLNEFGLRGCIPKKKPFVSAKNRSKRLLFSNKYGLKGIDFWKRVLWSDESKINMISSDGLTYVRRPKNQELNPLL